MNWPKCSCDSPGWCGRHFEIKDTKQWLRCLKYEGYRHSLDMKYGILPFNMTEDQKISIQKHVDYEKISREFIYDYDLSKLDSTKIVVLGHDINQYDNIVKQKYLDYKLLQDLDLGKYKQYQDNCFAESRVYLSDILDDSIEYIGVVTASWNKKFEVNKIDNFHEWENTKILFNSNNKNIVLAAERSMFRHNTIFDLFENKDAVNDFLNFSVSLTGEICNFGLWANQIICHREIYLKLQDFYRAVFPLVVEKIDSYNLSSIKCHYGRFNDRKAGLFFEFLTNVWFSAQKDLIILPNAVRKKDWYHQ